MLIEISSIKGNSGQGSPVFSKPGLMHNTMYMAFNKESHPRKVAVPDEPFNYERWKHNMSEIENKAKFEEALGKFESRQKHLSQ